MNASLQEAHSFFKDQVCVCDALTHLMAIQGSSHRMLAPNTCIDCLSQTPLLAVYVFAFLFSCLIFAFRFSCLIFALLVSCLIIPFRFSWLTRLAGVKLAHHPGTKGSSKISVIPMLPAKTLKSPIRTSCTR
jgi:hypothetical protein